MSEEESYFDSDAEFEPSDVELSESISDEASESDLDEFVPFPYTAQRKKRVVRFAEFEYY